MIKLITYPDLVHNKTHKLMLVCPTDDLKNDIQNQLFPYIEQELQVYLVDSDNSIEYVQWMMNAFAVCDTAVIDIDNVSLELKNIVYYMLAYGKTFYLTKSNNSVYNILNSNRIYDIEFIKTKYRIDYEK